MFLLNFFFSFMLDALKFLSFGICRYKHLQLTGALLLLESETALPIWI